MKSISILFFYIGLIIDVIAWLIASGIMIDDKWNGRNGTNNSLMLVLVLAMAALLVGSFLLKRTGHLGMANSLVWLPGIPIAGYGLIVLIMIIGKPDFK